jgi:hypothetical protein
MNIMSTNIFTKKKINARIFLCLKETGTALSDLLDNLY